MAIAFIRSQLQSRLLPGSLSGRRRRNRTFPDESQDLSRRYAATADEKDETLYVIPGSDAEEHAAKRFPHKKTKRVNSGIRPTSISGFLFGLKLLFQPGQAAKLSATYHFTFTGSDTQLATVEIDQGKLQVHSGHVGQPDLRVTADSATWLGFLAKERSMLWALLRRKIRIQDHPSCS